MADLDLFLVNMKRREKALWWFIAAFFGLGMLLGFWVCVQMVLCVIIEDQFGVTLWPLSKMELTAPTGKGE